MNEANAGNPVFESGPKSQAIFEAARALGVPMTENEAASPSSPAYVVAELAKRVLALESYIGKQR